MCIHSRWRARHDLAQPVHRTREHHGVSDRLDEADRDLNRAAVENRPSRAKAVSCFLPERDLDRLDGPRLAVHKQGGDFADGLSIGANHRFALQVPECEEGAIPGQRNRETTPVTPAVCPASRRAVLASTLPSTCPVIVTTPLCTSTSMVREEVDGSARSRALTLVRIAASSTPRSAAVPASCARRRATMAPSSAFSRTQSPAFADFCAPKTTSRHARSNATSAGLSARGCCGVAAQPERWTTPSANIPT